MRSMVEGRLGASRSPSTTACGGGPPPRSGEDLNL
jgi:hypothetical protein